MCARRQRISSRRIDRVIDLTRQCNSDADCVQVDTSSGCRSTCGAFVNQRYADRIKRLLAYLDQRYCATFAGDGCGRAETLCATQQAACVEQRCTAVPSD
jgi:hypothetical protein